MANSTKPLIIAHRGASFDAPENTMSAFNLAWDQGADGIECDVHITSDGVLVCHHDSNTKRQAGVLKRIAKTKYADLAKLNVAAYRGMDSLTEKIPTLSEVLETIQGDRSIFIEIKIGAEAVAPLHKCLVDSKVDIEKVTVIAFDSRIVEKLKREIPSVKTYWLDDFSHVFGSTISNEEIDDLLETCREIGADGMGVKNCSFVSKRLVEGLAKDDLELNVWTVDDPDEAIRFRKMGVDSVSSNKPGLLRSSAF